MTVRQMSRSALRQRSDEGLELRDRRPNRHEMERALGVRRAVVHLGQEALSAVKIGDDDRKHVVFHSQAVPPSAAHDLVSQSLLGRSTAPRHGRQGSMSRTSSGEGRAAVGSPAWSRSRDSLVRRA